MKRLILIYIESVWHSLNVDNFSEYSINQNFRRGDVLVTFQSSDLTRHLASQYPSRFPPSIIDLESLDKQMSQEGREFRDYKEWNLISSLKYHNLVESHFKVRESNIRETLEYMANLFLILSSKDLIEKERFDSIETPINKTLYERQMRGIKVDRDKAISRCANLEGYIYSIKNVLQLEYRIFSPQDKKQQISYLQSKGFKIEKSPLHTFNALKDRDKVCNLFYELIRSAQDLDSLLFISAHWGGEHRTNPTFLGFGTITSRIILRQPSLQNLRKRNRDIIVADAGMSLLYPDYSQFEAGILASLSDDEELITLYNDDIYTDLAEKVFDDKSKRGAAKITFYSYMYGGSFLNEKAKKYFAKFKNLEVFRSKVIKELLESRKIGTSKGNFRFIHDENESDWALSHVVQAHASLIYKNAVLRVRDELKEVEFLIPMHDATLYQVRSEYIEEYKEKIQTIYIQEFKKLCPKIQPKIHFDTFFEGL